MLNDLKAIDKVLPKLQDVYNLKLTVFNDRKDNDLFTLSNDKLPHTHNFEELLKIVIKSDNRYDFYKKPGTMAEDGTMVRWDKKVLIDYDFTEYGPEIEIWVFPGGPNDGDLEFIEDMTKL